MITIDIPVIAASPAAQRAALRARVGAFWTVHRLEVVLVATLLVIYSALHGINMFHYPFFNDDEGTYMDQAWAVVTKGQLSHYTYWYDHAPAGWFLIALWTTLTGGFFTFGSSVLTGRVLMFLLNLASTYFVFRIVRDTTKNYAGAAVATLIFVTTPYAVYFHRQVSLDNITTFWMLLSIFLLTFQPRLTLRMVWLSAVVFGIAVLSKENTLFIFPAMAMLAYQRFDPRKRAFAWTTWITIALSVISFYVLMALLKGELFPTGTWLGGTNPHVSLLGSLQYQSSRGKDGGLFDLQSSFWQSINTWFYGGAWLPIALGTLCSLLNVLRIRTDRLAGILGLMTFFSWLFFARGGIILMHYLIPIIPLLAINVGVTCAWLCQHLPRFEGAKVVLALLLLTAFAAVLPAPGQPSRVTTITNLWTNHEADAALEVEQWVRANVPAGSRIVSDNVSWLDLHDSYQMIWYWKIDLDPAIRNTLLHDNWNNVDYVIGEIGDTSGTLVLSDAILQHAVIVKSFNVDGKIINIRQVQHQPLSSTTATAQTNSVATTQIYGVVVSRSQIPRCN